MSGPHSVRFLVRRGEQLYCSVELIAELGSDFKVEAHSGSNHIFELSLPVGSEPGAIADERKSDVAADRDTRTHGIDRDIGSARNIYENVAGLGSNLVSQSYASQLGSGLANTLGTTQSLYQPAATRKTEDAA